MLHVSKAGGPTDGHAELEGERRSNGAAELPNLEEQMKQDIWNTICPVCGSQVPHDMPLIELAFVSDGHQQQHQEQPGIRLCSRACAVLAEKLPEKYRSAAAANSVAGDGKGGPGVK